MEKYDVIIIGGGAMGAASAEHLATNGKRVLLLEQFQHLHKRGSSHGDGRIIRYAYAEPAYVEMARLSYPIWHQWSQRIGHPLFHLSGGLDVGKKGSDILNGIEASFQQFGLPYQRLSAADVARQLPQFHLQADEEAILQPDGGVTFADKTVHALWTLAAAAGAELRDNTKVVALEPTASGVTVVVEGGERVSAETLIIAGGGWTNRLLTPLGLTLPIETLKVQAAHFLPRDGAISHRMEHMPAFIDYQTVMNPFYGLPEIDVPGVKIGWHVTGNILDDPDEISVVDMENIAVVADFVARRFPALNPTPDHSLTCRYTLTPDEHFILDRHPDYPQIIIGSGFSGHGFKFTPIIGKTLSQMARNEQPQIDMSLFSLSRFAAGGELRMAR